MKHTLSAFILAATLAVPSGAHAQSGLGAPASIAALPPGPVSSSFPSRPIRLVVPSAPGGIADSMARALAQKMSELSGQPVVIENRAGANTVIGTDVVAKAPADGYTLLAAASTFALIPGMHPTLPFDPAQSFAPITMIGAAPSILVVNPALPANTLQELIAYGKSNPGKLTYGSFGTGSSAHLAAVMFATATGTDPVHVPYKGTGPALMDLLGGNIQMMFAPVSAALPYIKSGKLRALAVTSAQRSSQAPETPTLAEAGVAGFELSTWTAILAPAGTPRDVINKLNQIIVSALNSADLKDKFAGLGTDVWAGSPDATRDYINAEIDKYRRVAQAGGIQADPVIASAPSPVATSPALAASAASTGPALAASTASTGSAPAASAASTSTPIADALSAAIVETAASRIASSLSARAGSSGLGGMLGGLFGQPSASSGSTGASGASAGGGNCTASAFPDKLSGRANKYKNDGQCGPQVRAADSYRDKAITNCKAGDSKSANQIYTTQYVTYVNNIINKSCP